MSLEFIDNTSKEPPAPEPVEVEIPHTQYQPLPPQPIVPHPQAHNPQSPYYVEQPIIERKLPWVNVILSILVITLSVMLVLEKMPTDERDDDQPNPTPGKTALALFFDDKEKASYPKEARYALESSKIPQAAKSILYHRIDMDDNIEALDPIFTDLKDQHMSKMPWVMLSVGKKLISEPLESEDQVLSMLDKNL